MKQTNIISLTFPNDFVKISHPVVPGAYQWLYGNDENRISIVGGGFGLYGDGKTSFEMWHYNMEAPQGWMSIEEINEYLKSNPIETD